MNLKSNKKLFPFFLFLFSLLTGCQGIVNHSVEPATNFHDGPHVTPLMIKTGYHAHEKRVSILCVFTVKAKPEFSTRDFIEAVSQQDNQKVERFIKAGADINWALGYFIEKGDCPAIQKFLISRLSNINAKDKAGVTLLHKAVERADLEIVKLLVEKGAYLNAGVAVKEKQVTGITPLIHAISLNKIEVARFLIGSGADLNARLGGWGGKGMTPLMLAASTRAAKELVPLLIDKGAEVNVKGLNRMTALEYAVRAGNQSILGYLMSSGAERRVVFKGGVNYGRRYKEILKEKDIEPALWNFEKAVKRGDKETISLFLKAGIDVNVWSDYGDPPIVNASEKGNVEIVRLLIEAGADVNARSKNGRYTALCEAARWSQNPEVVKMLVKAGADVNAEIEEGSHSILEIVLKRERYDIAEILINNGADVGWALGYYLHKRKNPEIRQYLISKLTPANAKNLYLETPLLHEACRQGDVEMVKRLIDEGADINARDSKGKTALDYAAELENQEMMDLLLP